MAPIECWIGKSRLCVLQGDITAQAVDAIVNAANPTLLGGGGIDGEIHQKGGALIAEACQDIRAHKWPGGLPAGEAVITPGGNLPARYVIHTVSPVYEQSGDDGPVLLASCYRRSLEVAMEQGDIQRLAFPSMATGAWGYPADEAAPIALQSTADFLREASGVFEEVRFVLREQAAYLSFTEAFARSVQTDTM